jgi:hypothetical protein
MNQFDGELAALRHNREMESLGESTLVSSALDAAAGLAETSGLPVLPFRKALKSGRVPVEEMVDRLESAAFDEIRRIWEHLEGQKKRQEQFEARLSSQEAQVVLIDAFFHGLRTSDSGKHARLARLTVRSIFVDDLASESLDDMMRAAVELSEADISLLKEVYEEQADGSRKQGFDLSGRMGSVAKLQAVALVQLRTPGLDYGANVVFLLPEGKKFYERLQEIGRRCD